jgi:hypothetical protein
VIGNFHKESTAIGWQSPLRFLEIGLSVGATRLHRAADGACRGRGISNDLQLLVDQVDPPRTFNHPTASTLKIRIGLRVMEVAMGPAELESRVLGILDRVEKGKPSEDSRDECKTTWPNWPAGDEKMARQLGGHANAARGDPILWLFGVDEKGKRVPGVSTTEFSDWYAGLKKHFEEAWAPDPFNGFYPKCLVLHGFRFLTFVALRIKPSSLRLPYSCCLTRQPFAKAPSYEGTPPPTLVRLRA